VSGVGAFHGERMERTVAGKGGAQMKTSPVPNPPASSNPWRPYPNPAKEPLKFILVSILVVLGLAMLFGILRGRDGNHHHHG